MFKRKKRYNELVAAVRECNACLKAGEGIDLIYHMRWMTESDAECEVIKDILYSK